MGFTQPRPATDMMRLVAVAVRGITSAASVLDDDLPAYEIQEREKAT